MKDLKIKRKSRLADYLTGKGFGLTLMVSLTLIGSTIWFVMNKSIDKFIDKNLNLAKGNMASQQFHPVNNVAHDVPIKEEKIQKEIESNIQKDVAKNDSQEVIENSQYDIAKECFNSEDDQENIMFIAPLFGKIINGFSNNELVKDKTMNDWRVHSGIDIAAPQGSQVKAIADGEIQRIYFDGMMGQCIEILHPGNFSSVYSGLNKNVNVAEGDKIEAGTVIGSVGDTAIGETALGPHLHLELIHQGEKINPLLKINISQ